MAEQQSATLTAGRSSALPPPSRDDIRQKVKQKFDVDLCRWQVEATVSQLLNKNVVVIAPTGLGKTMPFFTPLLFDAALQLIIITPLTLLGTQQVAKLTALGISSVALNAKSISPDVIKSLPTTRVIVVSPELALNSAAMLKFWEKLRSMSTNVRLIIDEAHLMVLWSTFRRLYDNLSSLKHLLPARTTYYLTTATLPDSSFTTILNNLALLRSHFDIIHRSNDRYNLTYAVRPISQTKKSKADLLFLIPDLALPSLPPPPFLIFVQSKSDSENIYDQLIKQRPWLQSKFAYVHADMDDEWRENVLSALKAGDLWGLVGTDAVGLGLDIPNIEVVVQYGVYGLTLDTLLQRFGRGGRNFLCTVLCLLFVELEFTDAVRREKTAKRSATDSASAAPKRTRVDQDNSSAEAEQTDAAIFESSEQVLAETEPSCALAPVSPGPTVTAVSNTKSKSSTNQKSTSTKQKYKPRTAVVIDPFIDDFVNAGEEGRSKDRRAAIDKLYGNSSLPAPVPCCERCNPRPPTHCCDICEPGYFKSTDEALSKNRAVKELRKPRQLKIDDYEPTDQDKKLRKSLASWRNELAARIFGSENPYCGGDYLLNDTTIKRLVDLVHVGVTDHTIITRQCAWGLWNAHGAELFDKLTPFLSEPTTPPIAAAASVAKCSQCKQPGHNKRTCPQRHAHDTQHIADSISANAEKENRRPGPSLGQTSRFILSPLSAQSRALNTLQ